MSDRPASVGRRSGKNGRMQADDADAPDPLDEIVAELYALPPSEFTAARTERARGADGELAARIRKVRKPVVSAWAVDLLAREGMLTEAFELGAALREAQESLDAAELARLGRQRRQLVTALARQAVAEADKRGVAVSAAAQADVEETLNAALIDARVAAAVLTGRLTAPIDAGEAGDVDLTGVVSGSVPSAPAEPSAPADELAERRARRAAEQEAREAERISDRAERERAQAETRRDRARARAEHLSERVEAMRAELARVEAEAADAQADLDDASARFAEAVEHARGAEAAAKKARAALD